MRAPLALLASLFASACCTSLPRLPAKRMAFPPVRPRFESVIETEGNMYDAKRGNRDVPVKTYTPAGTEERLPVVIVSHGIGEDRESYAYLGRALARAGFFTVHVTHAGTDRAVLERGYRHLYRATKDPRNWIDRALDVTFVLDRLASWPNVDVQRSAVVGHSAGAFTALAVAGLQSADGKTLRDARIQAVVPMSMPRIPGLRYDAIDVPALHVTGTCDTSLLYRTFPRHRRIPFEASPSAKQVLVTLGGVNHDSFSLPEDPHHDAIAALAVAFLRGTLLDDAPLRAWFEEAGRAKVEGVDISVERKTESAR